MARFSSYIVLKITICTGLLFVTSFGWSAERDVEKIFNDYCFACHGTGWEDAPVVGDSFAWQERKQKGIAELVANTINGVNAMPPKGTCNDCSEKELKAVVEFLIAE